MPSMLASSLDTIPKPKPEPKQHPAVPAACLICSGMRVGSNQGTALWTLSRPGPEPGWARRWVPVQKRSRSLALVLPSMHVGSTLGL